MGRVFQESDGILGVSAMRHAKERMACPGVRGVSGRKPRACRGASQHGSVNFFGGGDSLEVEADGKVITGHGLASGYSSRTTLPPSPVGTGQEVSREGATM